MIRHMTQSGVRVSILFVGSLRSSNDFEFDCRQVVALEKSEDSEIKITN